MSNIPFEFPKAPQFVDFSSGLGLDDSDDADKFFDVEQGTPCKDENKENKSRSSSSNEETPTVDEGKNEKNIEYCTENDAKAVLKITSGQEGNSNQKRRQMIKAVRRLSEVQVRNEILSKSQDNIKTSDEEDDLSQTLHNISLRSRKRNHFEGIEIKAERAKPHCMVTRNDEKIKTPKIELRTRSVLKNNDTIKNLKRKSVMEENKAPEKYMALAEHILHYQKDTPPRFHSHRRQSTGVNGTLFKKRQSYKPRRTIALTPKLMTSLRSRPVDAPTQEQREEMEMEEIKKHQIKAIPLNEKIFLPPKLPPKSEKPKTAPAPFNLTQLTKKHTHDFGQEPYRFTANPVPKTILEKPVGIAPKKELPITVPESPAITKPVWAYKRVRVAAISNEFQKSTEDLTSFGVPTPQLPKRTEVKPFSFELRDKQMLEKKEKKVKEVIEAEKKLREFKANPVPSFVTTKDKTSNRSLLPECEVPQKIFKARSPRVLRKEPFRPVVEHVHSQPMDIQLHTNRRAQERQEFDQKKAEKEEEIEGLKQLIEMKKKEQEEAEIAKLRKEMVHKAQPMPKFKPVPLNTKVTSSLPLTDPQSPKFTRPTRTTTHCSSSLAHK